MDGKYIRSKFKPFLIGIFITLIIQALIYGFYLYNRKNYKEKGYIKEQIDKCEIVINDKNSELTEYSYCKSFLEWIKYNVDN